jgi:hypothetical protein
VTSDLKQKGKEILILLLLWFCWFFRRLNQLLESVGIVVVGEKKRGKWLFCFSMCVCGSPLFSLSIRDCGGRIGPLKHWP